MQPRPRLVTPPTPFTPRTPPHACHGVPAPIPPLPSPSPARSINPTVAPPALRPKLITYRGSSQKRASVPAPKHGCLPACQRSSALSCEGARMLLARWRVGLLECSRAGVLLFLRRNDQVRPTSHPQTLHSPHPHATPFTPPCPRHLPYPTSTPQSPHPRTQTHHCTNPTTSTNFTPHPRPNALPLSQPAPCSSPSWCRTCAARRSAARRIAV